MTRPSPLVIALRLLAGLALSIPPLAGLTGCNESWARSRDTAILALERGDDRTALEESERIVRSGPSSTRPEAAYLGGIAAYRLDDFATAMRLLDIAAASRDGDLRARAMIQRGTVERALGRTREAATDLERGGEQLGGDTGQMALLRAVEAFKDLGLEADARRCLDKADRIGGGTSATASRIAGFSIQFGAFTERANAEALAGRIARPVRAAGVGSAVITEQNGLFKVQVDTCYRDIKSAESSMKRIKVPAGLIPTITEIGR